MFLYKAEQTKTYIIDCKKAQNQLSIARETNLDIYKISD